LGRRPRRRDAGSWIANVRSIHTMSRSVGGRNKRVRCKRARRASSHHESRRQQPQPKWCRDKGSGGPCHGESTTCTAAHACSKEQALSVLSSLYAQVEEQGRWIDQLHTGAANQPYCMVDDYDEKARRLLRLETPLGEANTTATSFMLTGSGLSVGRFLWFGLIFKASARMRQRLPVTCWGDMCD
jgi:hypothetical protein